MIGKLLDKLTYANVVATIALFGVLGGGAYAAFRVPPNSVGSRQLKAKAVTGGKIANATISGGKIASGNDHRPQHQVLRARHRPPGRQRDQRRQRQHGRRPRRLLSGRHTP